MTKTEMRLQHAANLLVAGTGVVYACLRYFVVASDPYSAAPNPWETWLQAAHIIVAPTLVFAVGVIWSGHIWMKIRRSQSPRRQTGLTLAILFVPMVLSGYLLQAAAEEKWRQAWAVCHWFASGIWVCAYLGHLLTRREKEGRRQGRSLSDPV